MKKKLLSLFLALVLALGCLPLSASAEETSGTWGEHGTWKLENRVLTFTSTQSERLAACYDKNGDRVYPSIPWSEDQEDDGKVVFGNGVTAVDAGEVFDSGMGNCAYVIPNTLLEINDAWRLFGAVIEKEKITLSSDHPTYQFENDALIDKNKKELIRVIKDLEKEDTYTISEGIKTIGHYSLPQCKVTIPTSVTCIEVNADHGRWGGADLYYNGTVAQWQKIENPERSSAICTDGTGKCLVVTSGKCGENATWNLDKAKRQLIINGTGATQNYDAIRGAETAFPTAPWSSYGQGDNDFSINSVVIEQGITRLGDNLLFLSIGGALNPQKLTIPRSVTSISENVASRCNPKDIYFGGTEAQWNAIEVTRRTPWNQNAQGRLGLDDLTIQAVFDPEETTVHFTDIPITPNWGEVTVKTTAPYGTTNAGFVTLPQSGTAAFGDETVAGTYSVKDSTAIPAVGSQKVTVQFTVTGECEYKGDIFTKEYAVTVTPAQLSGTVTITGASTPAAVGDVLTASVTTAAAASDYTVVWTRDGEAISGATGTSYTITADDCGKTVSAKIKAKGSSYTGEVSSSDSVSVPAAAPAAPAFNVSPSNRSAYVYWNAPADHGSAITGYTISITDGEEYTNSAELDGGTTHYTFTELENGKQYTVSLLAKNAIGSSDTVTKTVTPYMPAPSVPGDPDEPETPTEPTVETETSPDGTVTTTTTWTDGKKAVQEKAPDGSAKVEVTTPTGETIAKVELPADPGAGKEFEDVKEGAWYEGAVDKATAYGLFNGQTETTFAPNGNMTRGMVAQVLYNLSGKTGYGAGSGNFTDVTAGKWYENAIDWAAKANVVSGTGNGNFSPEQSVTREQLVSMLYRYAQAIGASTKSTTGLGSFPDGNSVSDYAKTAMQWAVAEGFISGRNQNGGKYIAPNGTATRAEVAAILTRFVEFLK